MRKATLGVMVVAAVACGWLLAGTRGMAAGQETPDWSKALSMFNERIDGYAVTRARLEEPLPAFDARRDPWSLMLTRRYLASAIRAARPASQQRQVFTPLVAAYFRDLVTRALPVDQRAVPSTDAVVPLAIYEPVPEWAMAAAAPALVRVLPPLPEAIEYRVVAPHLILWDAHAEILIDVLTDAFAPSSTNY